MWNPRWPHSTRRPTRTWETRLRACQDELANSSAQEVQEFRSRLQAILNSSMIAATSAVSENAKALLDVLTDTTPSQSLREPGHRAFGDPDGRRRQGDFHFSSIRNPNDNFCCSCAFAGAPYVASRTCAC